MNVEEKQTYYNIEVDFQIGIYVRVYVRDLESNGMLLQSKLKGKLKPTVAFLHIVVQSLIPVHQKAKVLPSVRGRISAA